MTFQAARARMKSTKYKHNNTQYSTATTLCPYYSWESKLYLAMFSIAVAIKWGSTQLPILQNLLFKIICWKTYFWQCNWIRLLSAVILVYEWIAESDSISSIPFCDTNRKGFKMAKHYFQAVSLGSHSLQIIFKIYALFLVVKQCLQDIN